MKLLKNPTDADFKEIKKLLKIGELVVYPTDTIYGIAANINDNNAIKKVYSAKKRSLNKPLSVCAHDINQIKQIAYVNETIEKIITKLLPGPYTLLLNKKKVISSLLTSNTNKLGIRIPENEIVSNLTENFPITTTSANISDEKTPDNIQDIQKQLQNNISIYIDVGIIKNNKPSTILDLTGDKVVIIRKGRCNKKLLNEILQTKLNDDNYT